MVSTPVVKKAQSPILRPSFSSADIAMVLPVAKEAEIAYPPTKYRLAFLFTGESYLDDIAIEGSIITF